MKVKYIGSIPIGKSLWLDFGLSYGQYFVYKTGFNTFRKAKMISDGKLKPIGESCDTFAEAMKIVDPDTIIEIEPYTSCGWHGQRMKTWEQCNGKENE